MKHGQYKSSTYRSWRAAYNRCFNPKVDSYPRYGGRGITMCQRWLGERGFEFFLRDMGSRPKGKTLDRKDNNKNYTPDNCRWATRSQQQRNKGTYRRGNAKGAYFVGDAAHKNRPWRSVIQVHGKLMALGYFASEEEAHTAFMAAREAWNVQP